MDEDINLHPQQSHKEVASHATHSLFCLVSHCVASQCSLLLCSCGISTVVLQCCFFLCCSMALFALLLHGAQHSLCSSLFFALPCCTLFCIEMLTLLHHNLLSLLAGEPPTCQRTPEQKETQTSTCYTRTTQCGL